MIKLLFALLAISGYIANINDKKELSYWLWLCSNGYWMVYNDLKGEVALSLMFGVYGLFCLYGILKIMNKR